MSYTDNGIANIAITTAHAIAPNGTATVLRLLAIGLIMDTPTPSDPFVLDAAQAVRDYFKRIA